MPVLPFDTLVEFLTRLLEAAGVPRDDAATVADHLARSDLAGHSSHGSLRVVRYVRMVEEGEVVAGGRFRVLQETPAAAVCSGGWNFGQVGCRKALALALEKSRAG